MVKERAHAIGHGGPGRVTGHRHAFGMTTGCRGRIDFHLWNAAAEAKHGQENENDPPHAGARESGLRCHLGPRDGGESRPEALRSLGLAMPRYRLEPRSCAHIYPSSRSHNFRLTRLWDRPRGDLLSNDRQAFAAGTRRGLGSRQGTPH